MVDFSEVRSQFLEREQRFSLKAQKKLFEEKMLAWLRVLLFLSMVFSVYKVLSQPDTSNFFLPAAVLAFIVFLLLLRHHQSLKAQRVFLQHKARLNKEVLYRRNLELSHFDDGVMFSELTHPYTGDLDVFGSNSLFQLVNQSRSSHSRRALAEWLSVPAPLPELLLRQQFVKELVDKLEFRQDILSYGSLAAWDESALMAFHTWLGKPISKPGSLSYFLALFLPLIHLVSLGLWFNGFLSFWVLLPIFLPGFILLYRNRSIVQEAQQAILMGQSGLNAFASSLALMEQTSFESPWAINCQKKITNSSLGLRQLGLLAFRLDNRNNILYSIFNLILLLDIHQWRSLSKWRVHYGGKVPDWLEAQASMEAILSLSGLLDSFPEWVLPELTDDPMELVMENAGHPLIPFGERVLNSFSIHKDSRIGLITGSNMAGKSTFLRTVGINVVLALAGAPVSATYFRTSQWRLFTGMRVSDNLQTKTSSFFAELKRIRQLLIAAEKTGEPPVLFLLDEVLKGTNSADRHAGARGLIRQLSRLNAAGLVSTHDLELVDLNETLSTLQNYSFHSDVVEGHLHFDYKLKQGPCPKFNAADLMALMGIETDPDS
jgi:hypothetical protein